MLNLPKSELQPVQIFDIWQMSLTNPMTNLHRRQGDRGIEKLHEWTQTSFPWTSNMNIEMACQWPPVQATCWSLCWIPCFLLACWTPLPGYQALSPRTSQDLGLADDLGTLFCVRTCALDLGGQRDKSLWPWSSSGPRFFSRFDQQGNEFKFHSHHLSEWQLWVHKSTSKAK